MKGNDDFKYHGNDSVIIFKTVLTINVGRDSAVGIATGYRLDGPVIESRRDLPHPFRPVLGPTQPPVQWISGLFPGVKRPRRGVDQPPHLAPRLKKG